MELIIGGLLGLAVGGACVLLYRKGVSDGMSIAVGEKPAPLSVPFVHSEEEKPSVLDKQYESFMNFQPKFTEERHAE